MGYTHYWKTHVDGIPESVWALIIADTTRLLANLPAHSTNGGGYHSDDPLELASEDDKFDAPEMTSDLIRFNGRNGGNDLGHETFYFERKGEVADYQDDKSYVFSFCKTARKPYDLVVCGVLIVAAKHAARYITVSSDGDYEDWKPAFEWVVSVLGPEYTAAACIARLKEDFKLGGAPEPEESPDVTDMPGNMGECSEPSEDEDSAGTTVDDVHEPAQPVTTSHTFVLDAKEFRTALEIAVAEKKTTIPVLSTVCLEPQGATLRVIATDLNKWTLTDVPAMIDEGAGKFLMPHRKTLELLKGETGVARITVKVTTLKDTFSHAWVNLSVGGCEYDLQSMNPVNFPATPEIPKVGFTVPGADLKATLGRIMVAVSTENSRYTLNGALFECSEKRLIIVATDGHRLALDAIALSHKRTGKAVIPTDALTWLHKQSTGDVNISFGEDESFFHVADSSTTLITRKLKGQFPDYHAVITRDFKLTADFPSADELAKALAKVARMADERSGAVKFHINGACTLSASSSEFGSAKAIVKASVKHSDDVPEITMGFNSAYVLDALKIAGKNPVALSLQSPAHAGVFTIPSLPEYSYVLMPMRM